MEVPTIYGGKAISNRFVLSYFQLRELNNSDTLTADRSHLQ